MPFEKVETQVDFPAQERAILEFWQRSNAFDKLREKNLQMSWKEFQEARKNSKSCAYQHRAIRFPAPANGSSLVRPQETSRTS